jgi:pyruvate ferredoxin oxidoreductase gamma subunit
LKELRIHGRGGQGAVLAAELLAVAALKDGKYGQAFPAFGGERRGAPVQAFVRLNDRAIRLRHRVHKPDYLLILDPSLFDMLDVLQGLAADGLVIINTEKALDDLAWSAEVCACTVPATRIGQEVFGKPLASPAMLGAFAAATGEVSLAAIHHAFLHRFPGEIGEKNNRAAQWGYDWIQSSETTPRRTTATPAASWRQLGWADNPELGAPGRPLNPAIMVAPRTSLAYATGTWRYARPVVDLARCNGCSLCSQVCPDGCLFIENKRAVVDYDYCKGCGICANECPPDAIAMLAEED